MTLGRCPLSIFCSRGTPTNPESITLRKWPRFVVQTIERRSFASAALHWYANPARKRQSRFQPRRSGKSHFIVLSSYLRSQAATKNNRQKQNGWARWMEKLWLGKGSVSVWARGVAKAKLCMGRAGGKSGQMAKVERFDTKFSRTTVGKSKGGG